MVVGLSPRANSGEDVEAGELVATDLDEVIPQRLLDAAKVVLRQAEGLDDAGRFGAAVPGDDDGAARTNDPMQLAHRGFKVGPDRDVSNRDHTVDAGVGKTVRSAVPRSSRTRPARTAFRLCRPAWSRISGDGSTPRMLAACVRSASSRMRPPGP